MGWSGGSILMSTIIAALEKHGDAMQYDAKVAFFTDVIKAFEQEDADSLEDCVGEGSHAYDFAYWVLNPPPELDPEDDGDDESDEAWGDDE